MTTAFGFFHDASLTQPVGAGSPISATQDTLNSLAPVDKQIWFGSTNSAIKTQANSNPGTDSITVAPADAAAGSGQPTTAVKLALSQAGLASATAGASLALGTAVSGGVANAIAFWVRLDDQTAVLGAYTDLSLTTNILLDSPL